MKFQWTDLVVLAIMLISGLLALARGFTREVLSLIAWGVAIAGLASALNPQIVAMVVAIFRRRLPPRSR